MTPNMNLFPACRRARQAGIAFAIDAKTGIVIGLFMIAAVAAGTSEVMATWNMSTLNRQVSQVQMEVKRGFIASYGPNAGRDLTAYLIDNRMVDSAMIDYTGASPMLRHAVNRAAMNVTGFPDRFEIGIEGLERAQCTKLVNAQIQSGVLGVEVGGAAVTLPAEETTVSNICQSASEPVQVTLVYR